MGAVESKTVSYNGTEITVSNLIEKALSMEKELESRKTQLQNYLQSSEGTSEEISSLESDLKTVTDLKTKLEAEIGEKDSALSKSAADLEATSKSLKETEDALNEMKAKYSDSSTKLSQCTLKKFMLENSMNGYKTRVDKLEACNVSKTAAASAFRNLYAGYGPIKKMLWENRNYWYMYIVEDFNNRWKNDAVGKYLWNVAIQFNNNYAICIFSTQAGTLTPKDQYNNFYAMNWALVEAINYSTKFQSHNINKVFFNGVTARKYTVKFWKGGHLQWETDTYNPWETAGHEAAGRRHENMNQTGEMWKWMNNTVNKGKAENDWEQKFNNRNYTMTATPEEGKIVDMPLDKYRYRGLKFSDPGLLHGDNRGLAWVDIDYWGFSDADDFNAALEAPFILRLEIGDLNECNRALEGFCPYHRQRRHNFIQKLVITILVILAACFICAFFFKKYNKNKEIDNEKDGYYTYYTA